ncbi:FitA-like ribbon-helix-helix domain-containing protein [Kamptonema formosum]|uniref:FitA-like ribbon-helix-helix domain-containing protein n=1 Tax=Kamptonema formosum TaxID=331992 RepID=UPI0003457B29|nr:hypothetical protein [Oscillatoria sp. PCC 10802]
MAQIIIEDLDQALVDRLEALARTHGRTLSAELKHILEEAAQVKTADKPEANAGAKTPEELGWPHGFFEEVAGGWVGEPLVRDEQGEYETREELA